MGIKKARLCPDFSWIYDNKHTKKVNQTHRVMVNLRASIFDRIEPSFIETTLLQCEKILSQLERKIEGEMRVCVAYQIAEDAQFSKMVFERLKKRYDVEYIPYQMKLNDLKEFYGKVDFHISNRMHSLLAGYKYGSLPIALIDIKKHVKISATFSDCEISELMIDINASDIEKNIDALVNNRSFFMKRLFELEIQKGRETTEVLQCIFNKP